MNFVVFPSYNRIVPYNLPNKTCIYSGVSHLFWMLPIFSQASISCSQETAQVFLDIASWKPKWLAPKRLSAREIDGVTRGLKNTTLVWWLGCFRGTPILGNYISFIYINLYLRSDNNAIPLTMDNNIYISFGIYIYTPYIFIMFYSYTIGISHL